MQKIEIKKYKPRDYNGANEIHTLLEHWNIKDYYLIAVPTYVALSPKEMRLFKLFGQCQYADLVTQKYIVRIREPCCPTSRNALIAIPAVLGLRIEDEPYVPPPPYVYNFNN